jgi:hypothetical protein
MASAAAAQGTEEDEALRQEGERIAALVDDLAALGGAPVRTRVEELVSRLVHLYGAGLARLVHLLGGERLDAAIRARLGADALVSSLLVLHGIHPDAEAAAKYDPGESSSAPSDDLPRREAGLVQIDLTRSRGLGREGAR